MMFSELICLSDKFKNWIYNLHTEIIAGVCLLQQHLLVLMIQKPFR